MAQQKQGQKGNSDKEPENAKNKASNMIAACEEGLSPKVSVVDKKLKSNKKKENKYLDTFLERAVTTIKEDGN